MRIAYRVVKRAAMLFLTFVGVIGVIVGTIIGIGYSIFLIDKHFRWGEGGIAIMTLLVVFAAVSILIAVTDEYQYHDNGGQET